MNGVFTGIVVTMLLVILGFYRVEKKLDKIEKLVANSSDKT